MTEGRRNYKAVVAMIGVVLVVASCNTLRPSPTPTATPPTGPTLTPASSPSTLPTATSAPGPSPSPSPQIEAVETPDVLTPDPPPSSTPAPTLTPVDIFGLPDIAGVVEKARPAVVSVVSEVVAEDFFGRTFRDSQSGSGVIFDPRGYILTNNHVVEGARAVTVTLDDGTQFEAKVTGADQLTDLAVLKIEGQGFPSVALADPSRVKAGDWVIAIGNALALPGGPTVTVGVVSALDRAFSLRSNVQLYGLIQTDASINPGNSGGPLLNLDSEVIGISTAVTREDTAGRGVEGIGFAVGMDTAIPVAQQLIEKGRVQWAWLGVLLADLDPEEASQVGVPIREGVLITGIVRDGPAWEAGARRGDVVVSMGGESVSTVRDLIRLLRQEHAAGDQVELKVFREKREISLDATLGERPSQ